MYVVIFHISLELEDLYCIVTWLIPCITYHMYIIFAKCALCRLSPTHPRQYQLMLQDRWRSHNIWFLLGKQSLQRPQRSLLVPWWRHAKSGIGSQNTKPYTPGSPTQICLPPSVTMCIISKNCVYNYIFLCTIKYFLCINHTFRVYVCLVRRVNKMLKWNKSRLYNGYYS